MRQPAFALMTFLALLFSPSGMTAQDSLQQKASKTKMKRATSDLEKSLKKNDDMGIAAGYEKVAQNFLDKGDNAKAEEYFKKALTIYTKSKSADDVARVRRNLAKVQESQNKLDDAAANYKKAEQ